MFEIQIMDRVLKDTFGRLGMGATASICPLGATAKNAAPSPMKRLAPRFAVAREGLPKK